MNDQEYNVYIYSDAIIDAQCVICDTKNLPNLDFNIYQICQTYKELADGSPIRRTVRPCETIYIQCWQSSTHAGDDCSQVLYMHE